MAEEMEDTALYLAVKGFFGLYNSLWKDGERKTDEGVAKWYVDMRPAFQKLARVYQAYYDMLDLGLLNLQSEGGSVKAAKQQLQEEDNHDNSK